MESKAKLFGHPVRPMRIVFPVSLLAFALQIGAESIVTGTEVFATVAFWNITAGVVVGLAVALTSREVRPAYAYVGTQKANQGRDC